ncbi:hypothetical protein PENTCL1PPCAC_3567 [Pristionchus entomophagus]|uniref:G protein-coupled receptor n=1 Tax=Pristionchus entomophagus TaxID=358040 RepID=A0AAV5SFJ5_9BILA|nr:hypothetical protein PENTCL1PPCAC_3567 [Pristionchus entomophagus]
MIVAVGAPVSGGIAPPLIVIVAEPTADVHFSVHMAHPVVGSRESMSGSNAVPPPFVIRLFAHCLQVLNVKMVHGSPSSSVCAISVQWPDHSRSIDGGPGVAVGKHAMTDCIV